MPVALPERFSLEVRLGRDGDLEEWLATDGSLDRPVLIRMLGPESEIERRSAFVTAVQEASKVSHPHLAAVYLVEKTEDGAYSVSEWTGGATLRSRLEAGDTIEPDEFLPNAAGLAAALGALHEAGVVHGGIDLEAITYTVAHPAKLGAFGRRARGATAHDDVRSLSEALEQGLTGSPPGTTPPSEVIDGLSPDVDRILREGRRSTIGGRALSEAFAGAPTPRRPQPESTRPSRRLLLIAIGLAVAAAALVGLGRLFTPSGTALPPPPAAEDGADTPAVTSTLATTTTTTTLAVRRPIEVSAVATFDPFGGGGENDDLVGAVIDGDLSTAWRTEVYLDPLPLLKPGVGLTLQTEGVPRELEILGLARDAVFEVRWAPGPRSDLEDYEILARLISQPGVTPLRLPIREDGTWLIWFTDLPPVDGDYVASVSEIRFRE
ncbi:MAG TPA: protein kinase [Acidimicrobiia bacterium]|nr:protein kinase [Acidimicrobiia bacterium]